MAWLCCKVDKLQHALKESSSGQAFHGMDEQQLAAYCIALLAEYFQEHWLVELTQKYGISSQGRCTAPILISV